VGNKDLPSAYSETVPSAVPSTSAGKLVIDRPLGKRGVQFVWSARPLSLRILPLPKASISGSIVKHSSTRLSTLAFCQCIEFDNADAGRTPACVLALRGGRGGGAGRERGSSKSGQTHRQIRVTTMTTQTQYAYLHAQYLLDRAEQLGSKSVSKKIPMGYYPPKKELLCFVPKAS
jgi:hypothetical protein